MLNARTGPNQTTQRHMVTCPFGRSGNARCTNTTQEMTSILSRISRRDVHSRAVMSFGLTLAILRAFRPPPLRRNESGIQENSDVKLPLWAGLLLATFLSGCTSFQQTPLELDPQSLHASRGKIGVTMTAVPTPSVAVQGADCVLCILLAKQMMSLVSKQAETLPVDDLKQLKTDVVARLLARGLDAVAIEEDFDWKQYPEVEKKVPGIATHDLRDLQRRNGIDQLVLLQVFHLGFHRKYAAYFPSSDPVAQVAGLGMMIQLDSGQLTWYQDVLVRKEARGDWDEQPDYPGLTNAYFQAVEAARDAFLQPFPLPAKAASSTRQ